MYKLLPLLLYMVPFFCSYDFFFPYDSLPAYLPSESDEFSEGEELRCRRPTFEQNVADTKGYAT
jgi:hypothetical protein